MNARELLEKCEQNASTGLDPIKFVFLAWQSFRGDFREFREFVLCNALDKDEVEKFVEICENRINRARALMSDIGIVLGFAITGVAIVVSFINKNTQKQGNFDPFIYIITSNYSLSFKIFFLIIVLCVPALIILLAHYRTQLHIWSAYKEGAIIQKLKEPRNHHSSKGDN